MTVGSKATSPFGKMGTVRDVAASAENTAEGKKWLEEPVPYIQLIVFLMAFLLA